MCYHHHHRRRRRHRHHHHHKHHQHTHRHFETLIHFKAMSNLTLSNHLSHKLTKVFFKENGQCL